MKQRSFLPVPAHIRQRGCIEQCHRVQLSNFHRPRSNMIHLINGLKQTCSVFIGMLQPQPILRELACCGTVDCSFRLWLTRRVDWIWRFLQRTNALTPSELILCQYSRITLQLSSLCYVSLSKGRPVCHKLFLPRDARSAQRGVLLC